MLDKEILEMLNNNAEYAGKMNIQQENIRKQRMIIIRELKEVEADAMVSK